MKKYTLPMLLLLTLVLTGAGCGKKIDTTLSPQIDGSTDGAPIIFAEGNETPPTENGAIFIGEKNFDGNTVFIEQASTSKYPAWIVIYEHDDLGRPTRPLNYVLLEKDEAFNIAISLPNSTYGDTVSALLHVDQGREKFFGFPEEDRPFDRMPAVTFTLTQK